MNYLIPNTNLYINDESLDLFENEKNVTMIYDVNDLYKIQIHSMCLLKEKEWFLKLAMLSLDIPPKYQDAYNYIKFMPYKKIGVSIRDFDFIAVSDHPCAIWYNGYVFRMLVRYPRYFVSRKGDVYDSYRSKILPHRHSCLIYPTVYIQDQAGKAGDRQRSVFVHKLVALAWIPNDDFAKNNIVDHIDDNKTNCYYKNLRWCSPELNLSKRKHGKEENGFVITRNIDTGEIKEYLNMAECSKALSRTKIDTNASTIRFGKIWVTPVGRFEIYKKKTFKKWAFENSPVVERNCLLKIGKETKYFPSIKKLKVFYNLPAKINSSTAAIRLTRRFGVECKIINLYNCGKYKNSNIRVYNINTKAERTFKRVNDASSYIKCSSSVVFNILKLGAYDRVVNREFILTDKDSVDLSTVKPFLPINSLVRITAISRGGKKRVFGSIGEVKRLLGVDYKTIKKYIQNQKQVTIDDVVYILKFTTT